MQETASEGDGKFWRMQFGIAIAMSIMAPGMVLARTYLRPDVPASAISVALAVSLLAAVPILLFFSRRILASPRLLAFLYGWEVSGIAFTVVWVALDGGGQSPYSAFFYVLIGHAALAFPPRETIAAGVAVLILRLVLGLMDTRAAVVDTLLGVLVLALLATVGTLGARGQQALTDRAKALTAQALRLADVDGLTGCFNHRAFHARLADEAAKATPSHPLSVLVLDIDRFKAINDSYGHLAGDEVLAGLGSLLRGNFRTHDVVGRIGGDEFAVALPDANQHTAEALERRLLEDLSNGALPHGGRVTIGIASTVVATEARHLLASADAKLYAKRRRDRHTV